MITGFWIKLNTLLPSWKNTIGLSKLGCVLGSLHNADCFRNIIVKVIYKDTVKKQMLKTTVFLSQTWVCLIISTSSTIQRESKFNNTSPHVATRWVSTSCRNMVYLTTHRLKFDPQSKILRPWRDWCGRKRKHKKQFIIGQNCLVVSSLQLLRRPRVRLITSMRARDEGFLRRKLVLSFFNCIVLHKTF